MRLRSTITDSLADLEGGFIRCDRCGDQEDTKTMDIVPWLREALATPTDSSQILIDWMREQLGESFATAEWNELTAKYDFNTDGNNEFLLFKQPEILK